MSVSLAWLLVLVPLQAAPDDAPADSQPAAASATPAHVGALPAEIAPLVDTPTVATPAEPGSAPASVPAEALAPVAAPVSPAATAAPAPAPVCKIAVLDLKAGDGFSDKGAEALTDALATEIEQRSSCEVMSRADIRSMISFEAEKQLLGCGEETCLAELGGALGVEFLVTGSVSKVGEATLLSLKKINLRDLKVERRVTDTFAGVDDEVVGFTQWMARRLEQGDAKAGHKPLPRPKVAVVQTDANKVKYVEKHMTLWRGLAWTGAALTAVSTAVTLAAVGGTYGLSWLLMREKTTPASEDGGVDRGNVSMYGTLGPYLATTGNVGLYATGALLVGTIALFFLPADEFEVREIDSRSGSEVAP